MVALCATSILFIVLVSINQVYATNPFFSDSTPYDFKVEYETVNLYIKKDGSVDIDYEIKFYTYRYPIPIVDIGFPNKYYDFESIEATIDGWAIPEGDIHKSEYLKVGVELHLEAHTIHSYSSGVVRVRANNPIMIFKDDFKPFKIASVEFSPTWFGSSFCRGTDRLTVNFYFPEGFTEMDSITYHYSQYTSYSLNATHLVYTWELTNIPAKQYTFGVSFPQSAVDKVYDSWIYGLYSPIQKTIIISILTAVLIVGLLLIRFFYIKYRPDAKYIYYKPTISIECIGILRELPIAEAAIILGYRMDRVVALIIFGLIRKGVLRLLSVEPLQFQKIKPYPDDLYPYESAFLKICLVKDSENDGSYRLRQSSLKPLCVKLIKTVNSQMKGHSRKDTENYYKQLIDHTFKIYDSIYDEEELSQKFEWLLLDPKPKKLEEKYSNHNVVVPYWYYHFHYILFLKKEESILPTYEVTPITSIQMDGLEFAANCKNVIKYLCKELIKNLSDFTDSVMKRLYPPVYHRIPSTTSGHVGGHGSCACACACACAGCACACAGGGR